MAERIIDKASVDMYMEDQCKYAIFIDRRRALPEIRDGLKTVQRRILYVAYNQGMISPNKREKSTALTGEIMKNYHPHGESYNSVVTMATWYNNKMPLIYGHGNWGSVSGSGAASPRYTECSLSKFGYDVVLQELSESKNVVNWMDTFRQNGIKEPEYLPVKVPLLLINGCSGIGVGIAVNIPTHSLSEVIDATINLIHHPNQDVLLIPDLCQPCELLNTDWNRICKTGTGSFTARGIIETEEAKNGITLHVRSLPDNVSTSSVYEKILKMKEEGHLPMLKDVYDVLDKNGHPDIQIILKPGSDVGYMKQVLYAKTDIQKSFSVNFEAVDITGKNVRRFSYKDYLTEFLKQRMAIKFRLYSNKLQQAMTRYHYIDAFTRALESGQIDKIIDMIKKSTSSDETIMIEKIIKMCKVTDIQAKFILDANLKKLSKANLNAYKAERKDLQDNILKWQNIITDDGTYIMKEIEAELLDIKSKYSSPRLCKVIKKSDQNDIPKGTFKIVVTEKNFIRKIPEAERINVVRKDNPKFILKVDNAENILLFDNKGKVFSLPIHRIPITEKSAVGTDIRILIQNLTADIIAVYYQPALEAISKSSLKHHFIIASKLNAIKRIEIEDFLNVTPSGLIYSKIKPEDEVVGVVLAPHKLDMVICSDKKALRYPIEDIPVVKRNAIGVRNMDTNEPIENITIVYPNTEYIVVLTRSGKFNKFSATMLDPHHRAQKGCQVIKLDSSDQIFSIYSVNDNDIIRVITDTGIEEVKVSDIKPKSKIAAGTKMIKSRLVLKADVIKTM